MTPPKPNLILAIRKGHPQGMTLQNMVPMNRDCAYPCRRADLRFYPIDTKTDRATEEKLKILRFTVKFPSAKGHVPPFWEHRHATRAGKAIDRMAIQDLIALCNSIRPGGSIA